MTNEMDACTLICKSIRSAGGWAHKIADPSSDFGATIQRPHDIYGALHKHALYIEAKYRKDLGVLDLQEIADHQFASLLGLKKQLPNAWCFIIWAVSAGRGDHRLYTFDNLEELQQRKKTRQNILKKELLGLPYLKVKKDLVVLDGTVDPFRIHHPIAD